MNDASPSTTRVRREAGHHRHSTTGPRGAHGQRNGCNCGSSPDRSQRREERVRATRDREADHRGGGRRQRGLHRWSRRRGDPAPGSEDSPARSAAGFLPSSRILARREIVTTLASWKNGCSTQKPSRPVRDSRRALTRRGGQVARAASRRGARRGGDGGRREGSRTGPGDAVGGDGEANFSGWSGSGPEDHEEGRSRRNAQDEPECQERELAPAQSRSSLPAYAGSAWSAQQRSCRYQRGQIRIRTSGNAGRRERATAPSCRHSLSEDQGRSPEAIGLRTPRFRGLW